MKPSSIKIKNAFRFDYPLEFIPPERGLVLFTGPNGAGKSSLAIEAVSVALWGKTLRGTRAWRGDSAGYVEVDIVNPPIHVVRLSRADGERLTLTWNVIGREPVKFETAKKAQVALEAIIGSWDVWRRTQVLSSADAAHFSEATDGERKRFLEAVFGLARFDVALKTCRDDLLAAENDVRVHAGACAHAVQGIKVEQDRIAEATLSLEAIPNVNPSTAREAKRRLNAAHLSIAQEIREVKGEMHAAEQRITEARAAQLDAERSLARVQADECSVCGQSVGPHVRAGFEEAAMATKRDAERIVQDATTEKRAREGVAAELQTSVSSVRAKLAALDVEEQSATRAWGERARLQRVIASAQKRIADLSVGADRAQASVDAGVRRVGVLKAAEVVLGLRGVRAHLLGRALRGIEAVAAGYLRELCDAPMRVRLPVDGEKIALEVEGAGGGEGYHGCSTGERRRIDTALVFALAEVAGAATGRAPDFLMFDELFDGLDEEGRGRAAEILRKLARERLIFVVSHRPDLAAQLEPTLHVRLNAGAVSAS